MAKVETSLIDIAVIGVMVLPVWVILLVVESISQVVARIRGQEYRQSNSSGGHHHSVNLDIMNFELNMWKSFEIHSELDGEIGKDLQVRITDERGHPVPDATVQLGEQVARTDRRGAVTLRPQKVGEIRLKVTKEQNTTCQYQPLETVCTITKMHRELRLKVPDNIRVHTETKITVVDQDSESVADVQIVADPCHSSGDAREFPSTDSNGQTIVTFESPSQYELRAKKPDTETIDYRPTERVIEVRTQSLHFEEYPPQVQLGATANFRVTDDEGTPVAGATVWTDRDLMGTTDEAGWVSLKFDEPGRVRVLATESYRRDADGGTSAGVSIEVVGEPAYG